MLIDANTHFDLISELGQRTRIALKELKPIAFKLGLKHHKASNWTFRGCIPQIYEILERATSKSEAKDTIAKLEGQLNGLRNWDNVERLLEEEYPNKGYEKIPEFEEKKRNAKQFFDFIKTLENGGTLIGIAQRVGMENPRNQVSYILRGSVPYLVRTAIQISKVEQFQSLIYKTELETPTVRGVEVTSFKQLENTINNSFPSFSDREDFSILMDDARTYFEILAKYQNVGYVLSQDITKIATKRKLTKPTVKRWICEGGHPKLISMLERALTQEESEIELSRLYKELNGVTTAEEMDVRLQNYYLLEELEFIPTFEKQRKLAEDFFSFIDVLSNGGLISDFVSTSNVSKSRITRYLKHGQIAGLVNLATWIPSESPAEGKTWLPLLIENGGIGLPRKFIEVPTTISSSQEILDMLEQVTPIDNHGTEAHEKEFGKMAQHIALMYLLGVALSDGKFHNDRYSSTSVELKASKKYSWNTDFGEGFCYALSRIGIEAEYKGEGETKQKNGTTVKFNQWASISSPLLIWMRRTLLGLEHHEIKNESSIRAEWIKHMPEEWKVAFLQGVADGDGHASLKSQTIGLTSKANHRILTEILNSLGINSSCYDSCHVSIHQKESILQSNDVYLFRYAKGRKDRLKSLTELLNATRYGTRNTEYETALIQGYNDRGLSSGEIAESLWLEHRIARRVGSIRAFLRKREQKAESS
ncbi:MAG: LAGLIDADG family homing endonuclease [Candidatus Thorarchaeota archaeon]|nr:LAGLIDADG family homing endonuclease [Candidatus Thorarchaeota archaeon]